MSDPTVNLARVVRAYLIGPPWGGTLQGKGLYTGTDLLELVAGRIYTGTDVPEGYRPEAADDNLDSGPGVLITVRGPTQPKGTAPIAKPIVELRSYAHTEGLARRVDAALFARLHEAAGVGIRRISQTEVGRLLKEPDPRFWPYVLATYQGIFAYG